MTVPERFRRHAVEAPEAQAFADEETRLTYGKADRQVDAVCARFAEIGLQFGDRVALFAAPSPAFAVICLAVMRFGAVFVGLNPKHTKRELVLALSKTRPRLVFAQMEDNPDALFAAIRALPGPSRRVFTFTGHADFITLIGGVRSDAPWRPARTPAPKDTAALVFTSGSSGQPKAAMLTNLGISFACALQVGGLSPRRPRTLNNFPISHVAGLVNGLLAPVNDGGFVWFQRSFDPAGVLAAVERERLTLLLQIPAMLQAIVEDPAFERAALSSLEVLSWGGGRLPASVVERLIPLGVRLCTQYGMTETTNVFTFIDEGVFDVDILSGTVGRPHPAIELRIASPSGASCSVGEEGEVQVRGPLLMRGYFEQPVATAEALTPDNWLKTGDIGRMRSDGNLEIVARLKDVFKSGGYNVYPREIEEVLEQHDAIVLAAVVSVPDERFGEVGHAFVQRRASFAQSLVVSDIVAWCRDHLANYKIPKTITVMEPMPLLSSGKVDRVALRRLAVTKLTDPTFPQKKSQPAPSVVVEAVGKGHVLVRFGSGGANVLYPEVQTGLIKHLADLDQDPDVVGIVLMGREKNFCAGADLFDDGFGGPERIALGRNLMSLAASCRTPIVAAIEGAALGGGLELAMACHGRVAVATARMGLPEVKFGMAPGAGGTQLVSRHVDMANAVALVTSGALVDATTALEIGLVDALAGDDLLAAALDLLSRVDRRPVSGRPVRVAEDSLHPELRSPARLPVPEVAALARSLVVQAGKLDFRDGLEAETRVFVELAASPEARALRHLFKSERIEAKPLGIGGESARAIDHIGVVGAGAMGQGIATAVLQAGFAVTLIDKEQEKVTQAANAVEALLRRMVEKSQMAAAALDSALGRLEVGTDIKLLSATDLVIEAVIEDLGVKQSVFKAIGAVVSPETIIASNTSGLNIDVLADMVPRPERVIGLHFFSPAHVMRLLEVVRPRQADPATLASGLAFAKRIGKQPVVCGVCDGFCGNRMLREYLRQAEWMLMQGLQPQDIDAAITRWGFAMGPFAMIDLAGLDVLRDSRKGSQTERAKSGFPPVLDDLVAAGRLGQKAGHGYYDYSGASRAGTPSEWVTRRLESLRREGEKPSRSRPTEADIADRLFLAIVNEGAAILSEGIIHRAGALDVVYTAGFGFPTRRGGPMYAAEQRGWANVVDRMEGFAQEEGAQSRYWTPHPLLLGLAKTGQSIFDKEWVS